MLSDSRCAPPPSTVACLFHCSTLFSTHRLLFHELYDGRCFNRLFSLCANDAIRYRPRAIEKLFQDSATRKFWHRLWMAMSFCEVKEISEESRIHRTFFINVIIWSDHSRLSSKQKWHQFIDHKANEERLTQPISI